MQAKKLWLNLPAWFRAADLPTVKFQLFRATDVIGEGTVGEAVQKDGADWIETLEGGKATATFAGVPTYDDYGNRYYYYVEELNKDGARRSSLDAYDTTNNKANGTVTNTYDLGIARGFHQRYQDLGLDFAANRRPGELPGATFELHQTWSNGTRSRDAVVSTATVPGGLIENLETLSGGVQTHLFTTDVSGAALLKYAPDGQEYGYYVVEKPITGYTVTPSNGRSDVSWDADHEPGQASFTNAYTPENYNSLSATKIWADQDNEFGTRPAFNASDMPIRFTLRRRTASGGVDGAFSASPVLVDPRRWRGRQQVVRGVYRALRQIRHDRPDVHVLRGGDAGRTLRDPLPFERGQRHVAADQHAQDRQRAGEKVLGEHGRSGSRPGRAFPPAGLGRSAFRSDLQSVVLRQRRRTDWSMTDRTKTVAWADLLDAHLTDRYITIAQSLPMYVPGSQDLRKYWTEEAQMTIGGSIMTPSGAGFTVDNPEPTDSNTISEITNMLALRKLYFVKNWDDENNRDGVRPNSIAYAVTKTDSVPPRTTAVTLTAATDSR